MIKHNLYPLQLNKVTKVFFTSLLLIIYLKISSCLTAGTHGSLDAYTFPVNKYILQKTVNDMFAKDSGLIRSPITDSFTSKYYNDGERYLTVKIRSGQELNEYIFQYTGDKAYWDTSKTSEISLAYAIDTNGDGGSKESNDISVKLHHHLIRVFKAEFIDKIYLTLEHQSN